MATVAGLLLLMLFSVGSWANDPDNVGSSRGSSHLEDDLQTWTPVVLQLSATEKVYGSITLQPRLSDNIRELTQLIANGTVGVRVHRNVALETGYEFNNRLIWNDSRTDITEHIWEHRIIEGVVLSKNWGRLELFTRHRLEQRFIENAGNLALRSRHLVGARYWLGEKRRWYLLASNELLVNLNDTQGPNVIEAGINQNRALLGVGRQLGERLAIESGYLLQYINELAPRSDNLNHVILIRTAYNLDFAKDKVERN